MGRATKIAGISAPGSGGVSGPINPKTIDAALVTGMPAATLISALVVAAPASGANPSWPYNAITPDGTQFFSVPQISFDDTPAVSDPSALRTILTAQDLDANHNPVGPEAYFDTAVVDGIVQSLGPLMGAYGTQGASYRRSGDIAYVRLKVYVANGVDQAPSAFQNSAAAVLQTGIGSGAGYLDVLVANSGNLPPGGIPATRIDTSTIGNGLSLTGAGLMLKLAALGGLAFGSDGSAKANLGYTMRINTSGQVELSNLPTSYGLPGLPSATYPQGSVILNTADYKVYRNTTGSSWVCSTSPADLVAGAIASGVTLAAYQISAGTLISGVVYAGQVNASQVNAGTFNGLALYLVKNGITVSVDSLYNAVMAGYYGLAIAGYNSAYGTCGLYGLPGALLIYNQDAGAPGSGGTLICQLSRAIGGGGVAGAGYFMVGDLASPQTQIVITPAGIYRNAGGASTQIAGPRQTGVGSPSGFTDATAQAYCLKMYNALAAYGAIS